MRFKHSIVLMLVSSLALAIGSSANVLLQQETNSRLLNIKNDSTQRNGGRSTDCLDDYLLLIDEIGKTYQHNRNSCLQRSRDSRLKAEEATVDNRNNLASNVNNSCESLNRCSNMKSAEKSYDCYSKQGSKNAKTIYIVNDNATQYLADLQEQFRLVQNEENKCTNYTKRIYEKNSSKAYDDLNECMFDILDVPLSTEGPVSTNHPATTAGTENPENIIVRTEAVTEEGEAPVFAEDRLAPESHGASQTSTKPTNLYKKLNSPS